MKMISNIPVKAQPSAAGTSRKRAAPYLKRYAARHLSEVPSAELAL